MDAIDPRVDYLKIDKWIEQRKISQVFKYCDKIGCDIDDVLKTWFEATNSDALIFDAYYFDSCAVHAIQAGFHGNHLDINIRAWSKTFMHIPYFGNEVKKVITRAGHGDGYLTSVDYNSNVDGDSDDRCEITIHIIKYNLYN